MDCWEKARHTNTHAHSCPLPQTIDISEKWASSKMCMNKITERGRSWWNAAWSLIRFVKLCWAAVSSGEETLVEALPRAINIQSKTRGYFLACDGTQLNRWDCWQIIFIKYIQIGLLMGNPHTIHIDWIYTAQIGLISTGLVPDRCVCVCAETSLWLLRQEADCECRHVS